MTYKVSKNFSIEGKPRLSIAIRTGSHHCMYVSLMISGDVSLKQTFRKQPLLTATMYANCFWRMALMLTVVTIAIGKYLINEVRAL